MRVQDRDDETSVLLGMKNPALSQRRETLRRIAASLQSGHTHELARLEALLSDREVVQSLDDTDLRDLILVVKHHRPDLALALITHVRAPKERLSLGNCLAAIWSRIDINAAWRAISASSLPQNERLALHSAMV